MSTKMNFIVVDHFDDLKKSGQTKTVQINNDLKSESELFSRSPVLIMPLTRLRCRTIDPTFKFNQLLGFLMLSLGLYFTYLEIQVWVSRG